LKRELELDAQLEHGPSGSFEVSVDGKAVAGRSRSGFPTEDEIVNAVADALGR
jgi:hypothetical protein